MPVAPLAMVVNMRNLMLALFDAIPDQRRVISQFATTVDQEYNHTLFSDHPEEYVEFFAAEKDLVLALLEDATSASPARPRDGD